MLYGILSLICNLTVLFDLKQNELNFYEFACKVKNEIVIRTKLDPESRQKMALEIFYPDLMTKN